MTDYTKLVEALLSASTVSTAWEKLMLDAAAAIEELQAQLMYATDAAKEIGEKVPKRGEWVRNKDSGNWYCTACKEKAVVLEACKDRTYKFPYCPNCGAKMEVQDESAGSL